MNPPDNGDSEPACSETADEIRVIHPCLHEGRPHLGEQVPHFSNACQLSNSRAKIQCMERNPQVTNQSPDLTIASETYDSDVGYVFAAPSKQPIQNHLRSTYVEVGDDVNNFGGFDHRKRPELGWADLVRTICSLAKTPPPSCGRPSNVGSDPEVSWVPDSRFSCLRGMPWLVAREGFMRLGSTLQSVTKPPLTFASQTVFKFNFGFGAEPFASTADVEHSSRLAIGF